MKRNKNEGKRINPDEAVSRGSLKTPFKAFYLKSVETKEIPVHYHEFHKVIIFLGGKLEYIVEGKSYKMQPGDILCIPAYAIHRPVIGVGEPYKRCVIWLTRAAARLLKADRYFQETRIYGREIDNTEIDQEMSEILSYINEDPGRDLSLEILSEKFFLSKTRLQERFKKATGVSPHRYIQQKRIMKAAQEISEGKKAQVAAVDNGFSDYSAFYRAFKKELSSSPRQYEMIDKET